jgi:hypothetical protein
MTKNQQAFDLNKVPQPQLVAFYGLPFAAASADGKIDKDELISIYQTLDLEPLDEEHRKTVAGFLVESPDAADCLSILAEGCDELRFATVVAVAEVIAADDAIMPDEEALLDDVCRQLRVKDEQKKAILHFVLEARRVQADGVSDNLAEKAMKDAAAGLAAVGVPIAAVYFSGSVIGLSAAGLTSGLAALGLGLGMVPYKTRHKQLTFRLQGRSGCNFLAAWLANDGLCPGRTERPSRRSTIANREWWTGASPSARMTRGSSASTCG